MTLFHICQEALANAAKHAKAKNVQISLWITDERILMEINDDGNGFDMDSMKSNIGHGIANIHTYADKNFGRRSGYYIRFERGHNDSCLDTTDKNTIKKFL